MPDTYPELRVTHNPRPSEAPSMISTYTNSRASGRSQTNLNEAWRAIANTLETSDALRNLRHSSTEDERVESFYGEQFNLSVLRRIHVYLNNYNLGSMTEEDKDELAMDLQELVYDL